jgi:uncharacterized membrane protein
MLNINIHMGCCQILVRNIFLYDLLEVVCSIFGFLLVFVYVSGLAILIVGETFSINTHFFHIPSSHVIF